MFELYGEQIFFYGLEKRGFGQCALLCGSMLFNKKIPMGDLQHAANEVFWLNEGLRTRFVEKDGKVYQEAAPFQPQKFDVKHFKSKAEMDAWCRTYATIPLKLDIRSEGEGYPKSNAGGGKPPFKLVKNVVKHNVSMFLTKAKFGMLGRKPSCCEIVLLDLPDVSGAIVKMHHIISDGWTVMLVANQMARIINGDTPETYSYEDFIKRELAYQQTDHYKRDCDFFEKQLEVCSDQTWIWPGSFTSLEALRTDRVLDMETTNRIREYATSHGFTPYTLFLSALLVFMKRKMKRDQFFINSIVFNRKGIQDKNTTGLFVRAVPILMELDDNETFAELLKYTMKRSAMGLRHQKGSLKHNNTTGLFSNVLVSYQDSGLDVDKDIECTAYYCNYVSDTKCFTVEDRAGTGQFKIHFDHNVMVSDADVDEMFEVILSVLKNGIEDDTRKICEL